LDLFDEVELGLESSNQGRTWFVREHRHLQRHPGLGRSYAALQAASSLSALVLRNPLPDESREPILALLRQALGALERGDRPDLVWLKALYCFLRDEGHPVKQQWWQQLPATEREAAARILHQPLAGQAADVAAVAPLVRRLEDWARTETETRLA
jgi:hypothetical protein